MKRTSRIIVGLLLLALATLSIQLSTASSEFVISTNWNALTNWTLASMTNLQWNCLASSSDGNKLAAAVSGGGIYTSDNAGVSWTQTSAPSNHWQFIASSSDGTRLAAGEFTGGIYTSTDGGATWTQTSAPTNAAWNYLASSSDGTRLAAGLWGGAIYISTNGGVTWTQTSVPGYPSNSTYWFSIASSSDGTNWRRGFGAVRFASRPMAARLGLSPAVRGVISLHRRTEPSSLRHFPIQFGPLKPRFKRTSCRVWPSAIRSTAS